MTQSEGQTGWQQPKFPVGIFAVIMDDQGRILFCHRRDYDLWNLPGGVLESGESPWDGVKREVLEETGFIAEVSRLAGVYYQPNKDAIVFSFVCKIVGGELTLNDEADRIEYFHIDKLPANTSPNQVDRLEDAIQDKGTICRIQTGKGSIDLIKEGKL